jgi:hypothetical protein
VGGRDLRRLSRVSANAIQALKDALAAAFWFKRDLYNYAKAAVGDCLCSRAVRHQAVSAAWRASPTVPLDAIETDHVLAQYA